MPGNLGIFHLSTLGVRKESNVVVDVNSSATTLAGLLPGDDGVTLSCREAFTFQLEELVILRSAGESIAQLFVSLLSSFHELKMNISYDTLCYAIVKFIRTLAMTFYAML